MAAIAGIKTDVGIGAEVSPYTANGANGGIEGAGHVHVTFVEQAVHTLVCGEWGKNIGIDGIAVFTSPSHIEHGFTVGIDGIDGVDKLLGIGEAIVLHLG